MRKSNSLGTFNGDEFIWNQNLSQNIFERRGNFNNVTLFGMTEKQLTFHQLPTDLEKIEQASKLIPETYEVKAVPKNFPKSKIHCTHILNITVAK